MDEAAMQQLNYNVDVEKTPIEDVAHEFLVNAGLISE
jgi:glycine betaine/choline ABC-type transport system substrate-binding protein